MSRIKKFKKIELNFSSYPYFIKLAFFKPKDFIEQICLINQIGISVIFLMACYLIGVFLKIVVSFLESRQIILLFLGISENFILLPFILVLAFIVSLVYFIVAKFLKGQGSFRQIFILTNFSFVASIIPAVFGLEIVSFAWSGYLIFLGLRKINQYSNLASLVNTIFPYMILTLVLLILGLLNPASPGTFFG